MSLKSVACPDGEPLAAWQVGYLTAAAQDEAHELVLSTFLASGQSRVSLARRLGKKPEQITRWLGSSGNWTLGTLASLLAAMGYKASFTAQKLSDLAWAGESDAAWSATRQGPSLGDQTPIANAPQPRIRAVVLTQ